MTTVLLIEYPPAVRDALRARLSLERDLNIIGEADDAPQGISLAQALEPDVVLIDAETPDLDAAGIVRSLAQKDVCRGIVVLSQHTAAIADRVTGTAVLVVGKHEGQASLVYAIRSAGGHDRRDGSRTVTGRDHAQ
jgi:DNA-binding NarL/FixJ family response regulator